jgi:tetratricopeptide (TPR) repeat protein
VAASRIEELRRRVQGDPASIAFAQLAEEYRRSGQTEEAVRVCRDGLTRHPAYLSARVTLGRALLDLGQLLGAREELEFVVAEAPENLAAVRGLAEISHREGRTADALTYYQRTLALARRDPELEEIVQQLSRQLGASAGPNGGLSFEEPHQDLRSAAECLPVTPPQEEALPGRDANLGSIAAFDFDRLVAAMGSPAAPPNVDAVLDGRASTFSLDLPEPAAFGSDPFAALEAELRAYDTAPGEAPSAAGDSVTDDFQAAMAELAAPAAPTAAAAQGVAGSPTPAPAQEPMQEGVLDDLENWLMVLQDRPSE